MPAVRRIVGPVVVVGVLAVSGTAGTYVVRPGDTLGAIAGRNGISVGALAQANGITDPNRVYAGQRLTLPGAGAGAGAGAAAGGAGGGGGSHTVGAGETLSAIAARYGTSVRAIVDANDISNPNQLRVGTRIAIPDAPPPTGLPRRIASSPARRALIPVFQRWAAANAIPEDLVMAVAWQESGWQSSVVSSAGAVGVGQLLPATARHIARDLIGEPGLDPRVPEDNIRMTARYLRWLLAKTGGNVDAALAGYYQGLGSVAAVGRLDSTVEYLAIVRALRPRFQGL